MFGLRVQVQITSATLLSRRSSCPSSASHVLVSSTSPLSVRSCFVWLFVCSRHLGADVVGGVSCSPCWLRSCSHRVSGRCSSVRQWSQGNPFASVSPLAFDTLCCVVLFACSVRPLPGLRLFEARKHLLYPAARCKVCLLIHHAANLLTSMNVVLFSDSKKLLLSG